MFMLSSALDSPGQYKERYIQFLSLHCMLIKSDSKFAFGLEPQILINQRGVGESSENGITCGAAQV